MYRILFNILKICFIAGAPSAPFVILRDLIKGVERSEQNNPVSCFANGDRRILRDVTKKSNPKHRAKFKNDSPRVHQNKKRGLMPLFCFD